MSEPPTLFDVPEPEDGRQRRDEGMARVLFATPEAYRDAFERQFAKCVATRLPFTSEDITAVVGPPPNHHNAIGALMNVCVRSHRRRIAATGYTTTEHAAGHARVIRIYRGLGT